MFRTYPRVDQIYLQIKKLVFLKIGSPRWGCAQRAVSSPGIDMSPQMAQLSLAMIEHVLEDLDDLPFVPQQPEDYQALKGFHDLYHQQCPCTPRNPRHSGSKTGGCIGQF